MPDEDTASSTPQPAYKTGITISLLFRDIFNEFYEEDGKMRPKSLTEIWLSFIRKIEDLEEMGSLRKKVGIRK